MGGDNLEEESGLPRATVDKLILESLQKNFTITKSTKVALKKSSQRFLNIIIQEADKICEVEKKKIINNQHVYKSLEKYGFGEYVEACQAAALDYDDYARHKPSKQDKFKESGKTLEELHEDQMRLFNQARQEQMKAFGVRDDTADEENEDDD